MIDSMMIGPDNEDLKLIENIVGKKIVYVGKTPITIKKGERITYGGCYGGYHIFVEEK